MDQSNQMKSRAVACLNQYIYEYKKGVRQLFMQTMTPYEAMVIQRRLKKEGIDFFIQQVSVPKVNLFFGHRAFIAVVRNVVTKPLYELTPAEDFMLGTLLGYDREQQCLRYLSKISRSRAPSTARV